MNKTDLKDWTRDMLEAEIINMNTKNFRLQSEVNNLRESNGRLQSQLESLKIQIKEKQHGDSSNEKYRLWAGCQKEEEVQRQEQNNKESKSNYDDVPINICLDLYCILNLLSNLSAPLEGHGYYYKHGGGKCKNQVYFTEGIGLHDGTNGKSVEIR